MQEILDERDRQHKKWGEQNYPMLDFPFTSREVMLQNQRIYKRLNGEGESCWYNILMEEVFEAFSEIEPEKQRAELIQAAAVAVQIIERIDTDNNRRF
jgi:hypothetical protein